MFLFRAFGANVSLRTRNKIRLSSSMESYESAKQRTLEESEKIKKVENIIHLKPYADLVRNHVRSLSHTLVHSHLLRTVVCPRVTGLLALFLALVKHLKIWYKTIIAHNDLYYTQKLYIMSQWVKSRGISAMGIRHINRKKICVK